MEFEELLELSTVKVLNRGQSARGKTRNSAWIALKVSSIGGDVLYLDTESAGSTHMVNHVRDGQFEEDDVDNIQYVKTEGYDDIMGYLDEDTQRQKDLIVVDTLDHKHTYSIRRVADDDRAADPDWNQYPEIYGLEKAFMERINVAHTNFVCTLDPESGSMDKPKGCQTNVHGYFNVVLDLKRRGDNDYVAKVANWINKDDWIGKGISNPAEKVWEAELKDRM